MIIDPGLLNHINHRLNDRESMKNIRASLLEVGWEKKQVDAALKEVEDARNNTSDTQKGNPEIFMARRRRDRSPLSGRLSVNQYLTGLLAIILLNLVILFALMQGYRILPPTQEANTLLFTILLALFLFNTFTLISISVRRLHDIGFDNTWALFLFIPGINVIFLSLLCKPGARGKNKFGEDPRFFHLFNTLFNR